MRCSEATLNSSHFQISVKKRKIIPCICIHKISRKSAQFSPLPPPDYTNRPFYTLQKLIHFRVQMSGTTTAVPKFDATCTKKKRFLAFTFNLNLQFQMLGFNSNIKRVMTSFQNIISVLKTLVATFTTSEFYTHKQQQRSVRCWFRGPYLKRHLNTHWSPAITIQTSHAQPLPFPNSNAIHAPDFYSPNKSTTSDGSHFIGTSKSPGSSHIYVQIIVCQKEHCYPQPGRRAKNG